MKVKILYILLVITSILGSCHIREEMEIATEGNGNIVLNFSVKGNMTTRAGIEEEFEFESRINHLDVLIYRITDGVGNSDTRIYHTRLTDVTEGTPKTLPGINLSTLTQTQEPIYKICIVANSAREESVFSGELTDTFTELTDLVETTQYINITGSTLFKDENGHNIAPQAFLMTGSGVNDSFDASGISTSYGPCIDLSDCIASELPLTVDLERAAAKIRMNFTIKENSLNVHTFANPIGADIYTKDNKEYVDITSLGKNGISYNYSEASYYLRNMTYTSALYGTNTGSKRKTNPVPYTDGGYMTHSDNHKTISVTAYVYSCSWDGTGDESFTNTPFMVVNLPLIEKIKGTISGATIKGGSNQKDLENAGIYLSRNYYEIPLRIREDGEIEIKRNHYYVINATIDAPGGKTDMEPFPIVPVNYYVYPWNEKSLDIGTSGNAIEYLNLSTNHIEMHNSSANSTIKFSSSSNIAKIILEDAYYVNKMGIRTDIPNTNNAINATATGMNGTITVNSPVPTNNAISYLTFQISNNDGVTKTFTVEQRPLLYITNTLGWYSYRDDITNTSGIVTHFENRQSNNKTSNDDFSFKVTKSAAADGSSNIYGYSASWSLGSIGTSQYQGWYTNWFSGLGRENARMYHIVVSSTSSTYKLGKPHVDKDDGHTINDPSNAQLVSPSFIIASQLGTMNRQNSYTQEIFEKAENHCKNYVETYIVNDNGNNLYDANSNESVVHLRGWRLPTKAEIEIIKAHQTESVAMDDLLIGRYYFCITGNDNKSLEVFQDNWVNDGYWTRCVRDTY